MAQELKEASSSACVADQPQAEQRIENSKKRQSLEESLADLEERAGNLVKATGQVATSFKKLRDAAKVGDLVRLRKQLDDAKQATLALGCEFCQSSRRVEF